ncbi:flagellar export chaperone FliS [Paenibacillus sp. HJGM_3]|uniref:flagellar export chaperone FliS n=1 Tax=Paenibacillus sp. HJGM_3 TaxID=3379816 RepID=UPI0038581917
MLQAQPNKYLENSVQTASPAQLLIMLCDGAIRFGKKSIEDIKNQDFISANTNIGKVQDIISEFVITLDKESPIAEQLLQLYEYFSYLLIQANVKKDPQPIQEVVGYLMELKETWLQAAKLSVGARPGTSNG